MKEKVIKFLEKNGEKIYEDGMRIAYGMLGATLMYYGMKGAMMIGAKQAATALAASPTTAELAEQIILDAMKKAM